MAAPFLIEDDDWLLRAYAGEVGMPFPLPWSDRRIAYVHCLGREAGDLEIVLEANTWRPSDEIIAATADAFFAWLAASGASASAAATGVRLVDASAGGLTLQAVSYESYARTNVVMDYPAAPSLRRRVHPHGALETLVASALANPLGVNILAINGDGDIPLQVRSRNVALRPGAICSTGSGGVEMGDISAPHCTLSACRLMRELEEELGDAFAARLGAPEVVGVARELSRGGQPEVFVVAEGEFSRDDAVRSAGSAIADEVASVVFLRIPRVGGEFSAAGAVAAIEAFEQTHGALIAPPLRAHLSLWFKALAETGRLVGADRH